MYFMNKVTGGAKIINQDLYGLLSGRFCAKLTNSMPPPAPAMLSTLFLSALVDDSWGFAVAKQ